MENSNKKKKGDMNKAAPDSGSTDGDVRVPADGERLVDDKLMGDDLDFEIAQQHYDHDEQPPGPNENY
jgi:hypothetical protein